jgi:hypothetical protein
MATCGPQSAERERELYHFQFHGFGENKYFATVAHLQTHIHTILIRALYTNLGSLTV